jgi:hypothetical protein
MSNAKPVTAVVIDPKLLQELQQVKETVNEILAILKDQPHQATEERPRYFTGRYFP